MLYLLNRTTPQIVYRFFLVMFMILVGENVFFNIIMDFSNQYYWLIIATFYIITVEETFAHRMCAHNMFTINTKSITYKLLTFLNSVNQSHGPARYLAIWHPAHHMYADKGKQDNVNFKEFWYGSASTLPTEFLCKYEIPDTDKVVRTGYRISKEVIDDPWAQFCERYSLLISTVVLVILYILFPIILFKVVLLGRFMIMLGMITAGLCHMKRFPFSYRHVETNDTANNNLLLHYMFLGIFSGLLQNNHHSDTSRVNLGLRWYEIDTSAPIAYLLKYLMEKKVA